KGAVRLLCQAFEKEVAATQHANGGYSRRVKAPRVRRAKQGRAAPSCAPYSWSLLRAADSRLLLRASLGEAVEDGLGPMRELRLLCTLRLGFQQFLRLRRGGVLQNLKGTQATQLFCQDAVLADLAEQLLHARPLVHCRLGVKDSAQGRRDHVPQRRQVLGSLFARVKILAIQIGEQF